MLTIAYLANQYPSAVEPYVVREIEELRRRGILVVPGSIWRPKEAASDTLYVMPIGFVIGIWAAWLCLWRGAELKDLLWRILFEGGETLTQRVKALVHTWLGACYALRLRKYAVQHIHVHHGYFAAWIAMVASRLMGASVSMTLHGSDVLQHATFMDFKLANCKQCFPISEFNRQHILARYSEVASSKVIVARLGVSMPEESTFPEVRRSRGRNLRILCIGRLHSVKGHPLLLDACSDLRQRGIALECRLAGEGPERGKLQKRIRQSSLEGTVALLGHVPREELGSLYRWSDIVVLTSENEGIPVVLMEAMARGKIVIAPAITGIPELIRDGETGFLYAPGSRKSFIERVLLARSGLLEEQQLQDDLGQSDRSQRKRSPRLDWIRHAARVHVRLNFNQQTNLEHFAELLELAAISPTRLPS
jgi:colanic acid/amylovoran biosynthesis glycosyltransferase